MKLSSLFTDHAVLQRDIALPVWGWTTPDRLVSVQLGDDMAWVMSNDHGKFMIRLPPQKVGGPYELKVKCGTEEVVVRDILVGEVWVASGQSNMEMSLKGCEPLSSEDMKEAKHSQIRLIKVQNKAVRGELEDITGAWKVCNPETAPEFSAVGYYFARKLNKELGVPVGIISSNWGGTFVEAWTSRQTLMQNPQMAPWVLRYDMDSQSQAFWEKKDKGVGSFFPADPGNEGEAKGWPELEGGGDVEWGEMNLPQHWQQHGHLFSGVLWFRKKINIPEAWAGKDLNLCVGAVDKQDITYYNGIEVGRTGTAFEEEHWNVPRCYPVSGDLVQGGLAQIAVRAYSFAHSGGLIGPSVEMKIFPQGEEDQALPLAGVWEYTVEHDLGFVDLSTAMGHGNPNSPHILHDSMIRPLQPYAIRGALWYQGESNCGRPHLYKRQMKDLIEDWRRDWGQGNFPFLLVQLANYTQAKVFDENDGWAYLRDAQFKALELAHVGLAVAIDVGDAVDIHPKDKKTVGNRLAQWALAKTYHRHIVPSGPLYLDHTIEPKQIRVCFANVGSGLASSDGQALATFMIRGKGGKWFSAQAEIDGESVVVFSEEVEEPDAVRYAWAANPQGCNLGNIEGFPASPFRTDC